MARLATHLRRIPAVGVTTTGTSLDVLSREMPFTQEPILEPRDFVREAGRRGVQFDESLLEDLHRHRMLIPFYFAHPGLSRTQDVVDVSNSRIADLGNSGIATRLVRHAAKGEVSDPEHSRFRLWARTNKKQVQPDSHPGIYYSRHQLLVLPHIRRYIEQYQTYFVGRGPKGLRSYRRLDPAFMPDAGYEVACSEWRSLAVVLSSLDTLVLPELYRKISWPEQWRQVRYAFDADAALRWLGLARTDAHKLVKRLLWDAKHLDDTGELYDVIRRATPDAWEALSGRTLMAHDLRVAAEIVVRVVEMAEGVEVTDDCEDDPIGAQRLSTRGRDLEEILTSTGLSPHPSLVVIVEGETEKRLFARVMETLGTPLRADRIRVENREGLDEPIHLLARYAARPLPGHTFDKWVFLVRPPTRVLVLADPEKEYFNEQMRDRQQDLIAKSIVKELPSDLHPDLLAKGTELVTVRSWPSGPFEFSHFSNEELADGLLAMAIGKYPGRRDELIKRIDEERGKPHATKKRKGPDIATVWEKWIPDYGFSKQRFADQMWPILEAQVRDAVSSRTSNPPIMDAAIEAQRLSRLPRERVVVERAGSAPSDRQSAADFPSDGRVGEG
ncbi:MAG TPA: hypothetical protein VND96_13680 [Candidatus Micrarchaeaceae archaeon]|nr:hypothetical protein [Candidatus Micrarchaeaceae archaeon]